MQGLQWKTPSRTVACKEKPKDWKSNNKIPKASTDSWLDVLQQPQKSPGWQGPPKIIWSNLLWEGEPTWDFSSSLSSRVWKTSSEQGIPSLWYEPTSLCFTRGVSRGGRGCGSSIRAKNRAGRSPTWAWIPPPPLWPGGSGKDAKQPSPAAPHRSPKATACSRKSGS